MVILAIKIIIIATYPKECQFKKRKINFHPKYLNKHEQYFSGMGFQNNWARLQVARGRESWGSGNNIHIGLNSNSEPYDYFLLGQITA